jgi:signal transduction histidine kinase
MCHANGEITHVLCRDLEGMPLAGPLASLIYAGDRDSLDRLWQGLLQRHVAFGVQLSLLSGTERVPMHCAGLARADGLLLIAAAESCNALLRLLQEQSDACFRAIPCHVPVRVAPPADLLAGLTRVNSDLLNLHRELGKKNAELAALTRERNELLAAAAHDLRNPLQLIRGYGELLTSQAGGLLQKEKGALVDRMHQVTDFMGDVLEQTIDYARLEAGRINLNLTNLDLGALVEAVTHVHRPLAARKQVSLEVSCDPVLPELPIDRTRMTRVLSNLLSNAINFSPSGGTVCVRLARAADELVLSISDQGQGIPASELPLLFKPFQTTVVRPTAGEAGTGLGLAIVRRLVEAHRGRVRVQSAPQQGTRFEVRLPIGAQATEDKLERGRWPRLSQKHPS